MKEIYAYNEQKMRYGIVILGGVLVLFMLLFLSFYNHPSADDYNYAVNARHYGFFGAQYQWYVLWSGRYFSTMLLSLNPLVFGSFLGYKLMSFILIFLSIISFYVFIATLFHSSGLTEKSYIAFLFFLIYILLMPSVAESYYWMAGAYSYQAGNILTLILLSLMIKQSENASRKVFAWSVIVVIFLAGTNETSMFYQLLILLFANIIALVRSRKINRYLFVLFIVSVICSLAVYLAPGNDLRAASHAGNHRLWFSVKGSMYEALDVISNWWWAGVFIVFTTYKIAEEKIKSNYENRFSHIYLNPVLALIIIFLANASGFFTCYWSLGLYPPMRTINTIYFCFIAGSTWLGICIAVWTNNRKIRVPALPFVQLLIPLLLMVYIYKYPNNVKTAFMDIRSGAAAEYNMELNNRYMALTSDDCNKCPVYKLEVVPKTLYFRDITEEKDPSMLESYAKFFGKDSIYIANR